MLDRARLLALICVVGVLAVVGYVIATNRRPAPVSTPTPTIESMPAPAPSLSSDTAATTTLAAVPDTSRHPKPHTAAARPLQRFVFRYNGVDAHYAKLAYVDPAQSPQPQFVDSMSCEVAYVAGGRGICLSANRGVLTTYAARIFDAKTFRVLARFPLDGIPSRCRVSRDGKLAALTVFLSGHGYASLDFSTQTLLVDAETGEVISDLEKFAVTRDGQPFSSKDFNYWGVTFAPEPRAFYATLSSQGKFYLVKGDVDRRAAAVVRENVECPSLSPDGTRIAYKNRVSANVRGVWRLHVYDLKSGKDTPLAETRSVDDQPEWLDNDHVLYALPVSEATPSASTNIWSVSTDGVTGPKLYLQLGSSPSAVR
jgi:hypothetical protein